MTPIRPVSVVFCTHDSPGSIGGPFTWLCKLLPSLRTLGVDSRVLALTHFGGTGPLVEGLRADGFDVQAVDCHDRTEDQVRWILNQLQHNTPAVFIPNFVVSAYYAARWLKKAGSATIGILHSDDAFYRAIQDQFIFGPEDYRLTDAVCVSEKLQSEVLRRSKQLNFNTVYIPMGADVPAAVSRNYSKRFKIAYVGRLAEEQKRISLVTRCLIAVCREIPNTEAVIYGDGPDRRNVENILAAEAMGLKITMMGAIPSNQVQNALLNCDAITLMSDYEGLPIALLEGMACGCIPICRMMESGIPQLVKHSHTGILISDNPDDFVSSVRKLQENPTDTSEMSRNARALIESQYSHNYSVECWARLIRRYTDRSIGKLAIPTKIRLPRQSPELESDDQRRPAESKWTRRLRRLRMNLGVLRRRWISRRAR
jgi:colanic acid/amylovoran biosynthesis glycosyltransferase